MNTSLENRINKGWLFSVICITAMILVWHGCSDTPSSADPGEDEDDIVSTISCSDLELGATSSEPVTKISLQGLGAGFGEEPIARIYTEGNAEEYNLAYVERLEGEDAELIVPVHPDNWREGGSVEVVIVSEDEQTACEGISLYIEGIEPSPVTLDEEIEATDEVFNVLADAFGFDVKELRTIEVMEVEARHRGLASLIQAFSGENNPNNIRAILDGTAPALADLEGSASSSEGDELLNAILNQAGFFDVMEKIRDEFEQRADYVREKREENSELIYLKGDLSFPKSSETELRQVLPAELDELMEDQAWFVGMNSGYSGQMRDILEVTFGSLSVTLGAIGALPVAAKLSAAGVATTAVGLYWSYSESILPSIMHDIEIEADPVSYNEDQDDVGSWTASLEVHSTGWTLTWPNVVSLVPLLGPAGRMIGVSVSIPGISPLSKTLLEAFHGYFTAIWGMTAESGPYTIPAMVYEIKDGITPSRSQESNYFAWGLNREFGELDDGPFVFGENDTEYRPVSVGRSTLQIRTNINRFAEQFREARTELEVKAIEVEIKPGPGAGEGLQSGPPFYVQSGTGEVIPFVAEVSNAEEYEITWSLTGEGSLVRTEDEEADYVAPDREHLDLLVAAVEASGGARDHPNALRRSDDVRIYAVESQLIVTPGVNCVELDTEKSFSAVLDGDPISFGDLEWDISGPGSLSSDGTYISGSEGEVTIEFRLRDDENITYEIRFEVREFCTTPDLTISPVPFCLEPDQSHAFNVLVNNQPVSFDSVDWVVSGPGSLSADGVFTSSGTGDVSIEFRLKERPDVVKEISFQVEEVCSYLRVTFTGPRDEWGEPFPYEAISTCVSLEPLEPRDANEVSLFGDEAWMISASDSDPFTIEIWFHEDLILTEESGWTRTLWPHLWPAGPIMTSEEYNMKFISNPNFDRHDPDNYSWLSFDGGWGSARQNQWPFEITRETKLMGNDVVQTFSGHFEGLANTRPLRVYSTQNFRVEFQNVMPEEFGCR